MSYLKVPSSQIGSTWEWYHWIGLEKDVNRYRFWFFYLTLEYLKILQSSSRFMQKWIQPLACSDHGLHWILSFYWWAHFYLMKKSAALFWFGLWDVGILYSQVVIQRKIESLTHFWSTGSVEKITVWAHANHDPNKQEVGFIVARSGSELWTLIKYIR
jgi:hypothetical protein